MKHFDVQSIEIQAPPRPQTLAGSLSAHFGDAEHPDRLIVNARIGAS